MRLPARLGCRLMLRRRLGARLMIISGTLSVCYGDGQ